MSKIVLSVVVTLFNENKNLPKLHQEILAALKIIDAKSEVIYVDDGSTDDSLTTLKSLVKKGGNKNISFKIISFRRNFGQTPATSAGIDHAQGSLVGFLDADLQNDPKDLITFYKEINKGYDGVFGWRRRRQDKRLRKFFSSYANQMIGWFFKVPLHDVGCTLRIVKKELLNDLNLYGESHRILPVLIFWKSPNIKELVVNHRQRIYENSKYGYKRILKLIIDLITVKFLNSYGTKPAYVFGTFGVVCNILGFIALIIVARSKLVFGVFVHRNPLFLIAIFLILVGVQFFLMGLLAELLVRNYFETQKKTTYEIKEIKNF